MKIFILVNLELQKICKQEIKELIQVDAKVSSQVLEVEVSKEQLNILVTKCQSARRILVAMSQVDSLEKISFSNLEVFESGKSLKLVVENVQGQENRLKIAKEVASQLFSDLKKKNLNLQLDLKKPDYKVVVWKDANYYIGLDQAGEMNAREYRVFAHSATFKGDASYFIVRYSQYKPGEKLLIGYSKDGSIAIEAARFSKSEVKAFDESRQNITAARKNSTIAGVQVDYQRYSLEELDTRFDKGEFDKVIFHITKKDEQALNELYYQVKYILKRKSIAVFITRPTWDMSVSDAFELIEKKELPIGHSSHTLWKLKKK